MSKKTIEELYQRKELHDHILHAPDVYMGAIEDRTCQMWICDPDTIQDQTEIIFKEITYSPGFYKIYDEILVNAADHTVRCETCNRIKVDIDINEGRITVWNNGAGLDVVVHKINKTYVPTMMFGDLLTSTQYDTNEEKIVGGKNGIGAKLTNIYSTEFVVETLDTARGLEFYQKFSNNMYQVDDPVINKIKNKKSYTKISFVPDYARFNMDGINDDIFGLLRKRVYDVAMTTGVDVYFNGYLIPHKNFLDYVNLYFPTLSDHKMVADTKHNRWKICAVYDPSNQMEHQNISFVNSVCTYRGGTHVGYIVDQVVSHLKKIIRKKLKTESIKPSIIKENLLFFIDAVIVNPMFDTQTKEMLTTKSPNFGSSYEVTATFLKKIVQTGVVDNIINNIRAREMASLSKTDGKLRGAINLEKLYDAHKAGPREGYKCTLILTEGDSAKTFAMSGLNVVGRNYYGVFPLRGKLLNVRKEKISNISTNEEIIAIKKIIGLEQGKVYNQTNGLRYGKIMVLADQDEDGYHIKGLVMNFIHHYWPSLIKLDGFIQSFATPLLKVFKGTGNRRKVIEFTRKQEYEEWKIKHENETGWKCKYYKGLGTSDAAEAQQCFEDLDSKQADYVWVDHVDMDEYAYEPKSKDVSEDAIKLAFEKTRANDRKVWINLYDKTKSIEVNQKKISYFDFFHKEFITYSVESVIRVVPNIMDGFKPSQRKVFYGSCVKGLYNHEMRVVELQGAVSEITKYHHGDKSLMDTIVGMAQNFVGSNNINLLLPLGQHGSRLMGGHDAASARYISTQLNPLCKYIFIDHDNQILDHQTEDDKQIEPGYYAPIIPMVLVNGVIGIGTGYSTTIPPCNPRDICQNIKRMMAGKNPIKMKPWFRHFRGTIEKLNSDQYISRGIYEMVDDNTIHITELPIGIWTDWYKNFLNQLLIMGKETPAKIKKDVKPSTTKKSGSKAAKKPAKPIKVAKENPVAQSIKSYKENCTDTYISITITFYPNTLRKLIRDGILEKKLNLINSTHLHITNMHLFDVNGKIKKYDSFLDILTDFYYARTQIYQKRKDYLIGKWEKEIQILAWKVKFIQYVIQKKIIFIKHGESKKRSEIIDQLENHQFPKLSVNEKIPSYKYILDTGLFELTYEEITKLEEQLEQKNNELATLMNQTPEQIWEEELDIFMDEYNKWEAECDQNYHALAPRRKKSHGAKK